MSEPLKQSFSPCQRFRYSLHFQMSHFTAGVRLVVVTLHPLMGDRYALDRETAQVLAIARGLRNVRTVEIVSLFSRRCATGATLRTAADIVGPDTEAAWAAALARADLVAVAWGARGAGKRRTSERWRAFTAFAATTRHEQLYAFGVDAEGHPMAPGEAKSAAFSEWRPVDD